MNTKLRELDKLIDEISSGGSATGHAGTQDNPPLGDKNTMKRFNKKEKEESTLKGDRLAEDDNDEETTTEAKLRNYIRSKLTTMLEAQSRAFNRMSKEEKMLREAIRSIIKEVEDTNPHPNTGINKLRDAFKKAKPTVRRFYKQLTTDQEQRASFSAHMLKAFSRMFDEVDAMSAIKGNNSEPQDLISPPDEMGIGNQEDGDNKINVDIEQGADEFEEEIPELVEINNSDIMLEADEFDLDPELKNIQSKETERSEFGAGLEDLDKTGRNQALDAMKLIRAYFAEPYNDMENDEDKRQFRDWALYNLDLLMKSYEDELQATVQTPDIEV